MNNKGFTMVELIAVITILSIIMIIAVPAYSKVSNNIKKSSLKNKEDVISTQMLKYANKYLLDEIKPAGSDCTTNPCTKDYDLYDYIIKYNIYTAEEVDNNVSVIINPVTNRKLCGKVVITYDIDNYKLTANFKEGEC